VFGIVQIENRGQTKMKAEPAFVCKDCKRAVRTEERILTEQGYACPFCGSLAVSNVSLKRPTLDLFNTS
jgi:DNA-directed RNA polymerase subunit RPC12/RpoP